MSQVTVAGKAFNVKCVPHTAPRIACHGCFFDDAELCPLEVGETACVALPYGGQFVPADDASKMQAKPYSAHGLGNEVFAVGETVLCVRSLLGSLTDGHTYTVLEYHPSGTGNSHRSPACVRVVGDCGSKLLLNPQRFTKIDHQPQTKEPL